MTIWWFVLWRIHFHIKLVVCSFCKMKRWFDFDHLVTAAYFIKVNKDPFSLLQSNFFKMLCSFHLLFYTEKLWTVGNTTNKCVCRHLNLRISLYTRRSLSLITNHQRVVMNHLKHQCGNYFTEAMWTLWRQGTVQFHRRYREIGHKYPEGLQNEQYVKHAYNSS